MEKGRIPSFENRISNVRIWNKTITIPGSNCRVSRVLNLTKNPASGLFRSLLCTEVCKQDLVWLGDP